MRGPMFSQFNPPYLHTPTQPPGEKEEMDMASQENQQALKNIPD